MSTWKRLIVEAHRRSLWQVLGVYAVASWVIWQVIGSLYEWIGLPSWVPGAALILLLVGLPIVLATAFVQEGAPGLGGGPGLGGAHDPQAGAVGGAAGDGGSAQGAPLPGLETTPETVAGEGPNASPTRDPTTSPTPTAKPRSGTLFTWNRAITGGVLAFAALGLASAGFMGMRALGIGPAATLISSGQLEERAPVVLADFESLTGDAVLARVVTEAFRADLAQSTAIELANPEDVSYVLERMGREAEVPLDASTAREVATRGGMKAVVAGEIGEIGGRYVLSARIIGSLDGEVLVTEQETAPDSTGLVAAIDRLAKSIREEIGESLRSIRRSPYLTALTTPSLPALKKLVQSYEAHNRGEDDRVLALLAEAIELDPEFSEAHRKRAAILWNQGRTGEAIEALDRALAHPERLTDYERYHARALRAVATGRIRAAVNEYRALLELDSADSRALNNLGNAYFLLGDWRRVEEALRRSLEVADEGPERGVFGGTYGMLAGVRWNLGHSDSAVAALEELRAVDPDHPELLNAAGSIAAAEREYGAAETQARKLIEEYTGGRARSLGQSLLAAIRASQGRLAEAIDQLEAASDVVAEGGDELGALRNRLFAVVLEAEVAGDTAAGRQRLRQARDAYDLGDAAQPPWDLLGRAYARIGQLDSARVMLERLRAQPEWTRQGLSAGTLPATEAAIAMAEGDYATAAASWRSAIEAQSWCGFCFRAQLGLAEELRGNDEAAIAAYTEYLEAREVMRGSLGFLYPDGDPYYLGLTLERLAGLHEQAGDTALAARYYREFVDLWEDADTQLQPRVDAARRALEGLAAEG